MTNRRRYSSPYAAWRFYVSCKGNESSLFECSHSMNYNTSRDVHISCIITGIVHNCC